MARSQGTVDWFRAQVGYGYIRPDEGGEDVRVQRSDIQAEVYTSLKPGQRVEFDIVQGPDEPVAQNVRVIGDSGSFQGAVRGH